MYLLTDPSNRKPLDWLSRLQIAEDAAKGWRLTFPVHLVTIPDQ